MKKLIKRVLKITPGGKKFIKDYKNLVKEHDLVKAELSDLKIRFYGYKEFESSDDYQAFFRHKQK